MFFGRRINEIEKGKRKELGEVTKNKEKEVARRGSEDKGKHKCCRRKDKNGG